MYPHGDPIISGVEDKPDSYKGPTCGYTVREKKGDVETIKKCASPEVIWNVTGRGVWGREKETPVCGKHIEKAWKEWNVDSAVPIKK
jgi:hypothetical protein